MKSLKFRRRLLAAVLSGATCLSLFLSGCTGERDTRPVWVLATASPEDTVTQLFAERFAQEVEELCGVCGGIGEYLNIDPTLVRLLAVLLGCSGTGILVYIIAAIIIPDSPV